MLRLGLGLGAGSVLPLGVVFCSAGSRGGAWGRFCPWGQGAGSGVWDGGRFCPSWSCFALRGRGSGFCPWCWVFFPPVREGGGQGRGRFCPSGSRFAPRGRGAGSGVGSAPGVKFFPTGKGGWGLGSVLPLGVAFCPAGSEGAVRGVESGSVLTLGVVFCPAGSGGGVWGRFCPWCWAFSHG